MKLENDMVDKKFNIANLSMSSDVSGGGSPRKDFSIHGLLAAGMGLILHLDFNKVVVMHLVSTGPLFDETERKRK